MLDTLISQIKSIDRRQAAIIHKAQTHVITLDGNQGQFDHY